MKEEQVRPSHYGGNENPFEPIKIIEHYDLGFNLGNVLKYILRHKKKDGLKDLKKALTYILFEIGRVERMEQASQSTPSVGHQNKPLNEAQSEAFLQALDYPPLGEVKVEIRSEDEELVYLQNEALDFTEIAKAGIEDKLIKVNSKNVVYELERDFGFMVFITRAKDCDVFIERLKSVKKKSLDELNALIKKLENLDRNCNYTKQVICLRVEEGMIHPYYIENPCNKSFISSKNFLLWED